jgi:hypothetical protein
MLLKIFCSVAGENPEKNEEWHILAWREQHEMEK